MAAYTGITYTTGTNPLSAEEIRQTDFTHRITIPYTAFNTITGGTTGDTIDVAVGTTPVNWAIDRAAMYVRTAFTTASTGTLTLSLGISSSTASMIAAQNLLVAGAKNPVAGLVVASASNTSGTSAATISVRLTTGTAGVLTDIASGAVDILIRVIDYAGIDGANA